MRWIFISCFLLASATVVFSNSRPKRDLWSLKQLISSKILGTETIVIQLPKIPKNETSQLFKIKGYDNIFLKVTRKSDNVKPATEKPKDPVIVSPEIAIIGSYLGTTTEGETLFALEIAKNLLKSGILSGGKMVDIREPVKLENIVTNDRDSVYILPALDSSEAIEVLNPQPIAVYPSGHPPMVLATQAKYRPQTKYSYKQEGENADMKFESYNNQGVVVTRTNKVPEKPKYITLRLAEVASIGANPFLITTKQSVPVINQEYVPQPYSMMPIPIQSHVSKNLPVTATSMKSAAHSEIAATNDLYDEVPNFIKISKKPFDIRDHLSDVEVDKINKFINAKLEHNKNTNPKLNLNENIENGVPHVTENVPYYKNYLEARNKYSDLLHRYVFQQLGDVNITPTVVEIDDPKLNQSVNFVSHGELPKGFVYMPPLDADVPPLPNGVPNTIGYQENNINDYEIFVGELTESGVVPNGEGNNHPTTKDASTNKKNTEPEKNALNNYDGTRSTITVAPYKSGNVVKHTSSPFTVKRINNVTKHTTVNPEEKLTIIGLNAKLKQNTSTRAGTLKTNVKNNDSMKKNPIVVEDVGRKTSTMKSFRPTRKFNATTARPFTGGPVF